MSSLSKERENAAKAILNGIQVLQEKIGTYRGSTGEEANAKAIEALANSFKTLATTEDYEVQRDLSGYK